MVRRRSIFGIAAAMMMLSMGGCKDQGLTTFQYENKSSEAIYVDVKGISPDPSAGNLMPGAGRDRLSRVQLNFGEPVQVADKISIEWTTKAGENRRSQDLERKALSIPSVIRGGEVRLIYSADGKWSIKYKRRL